MIFIHHYKKHSITKHGISIGWDKGLAIILYFPIGMLKSDVYATEFSFDKYMGKGLKMLRIYIHWAWRPVIRSWNTLRYPIGDQRHIHGDGWKKCGICKKMKYYHDGPNGLNCPDPEAANAFHEQGKRDMEKSDKDGKPHITVWDENSFYLDTVFEEI